MSRQATGSDERDMPTMLPARSTSLLLTALAVLGGGLTGCAVTSDPTDLAPELYVEEPDYAPEAVDAFRMDGVGSAYGLVTDFALEHAFKAPLLDPARSYHGLAELTLPVLPRLVPEGRRTFAAQVASAVAGDLDAQDGLRVLTFYGWRGPGWSLPEDGDPVVFEHLTEPSVEFVPATSDRPEQLLISFVHTARLRFVDDGAPFHLDVQKDMAFWMVPATGTDGPSWLIDSYDGVFRVTEVG